MKLLVIFLTYFVLLTTFCASQELKSKKCRRCNLAFRCANVEEPVWTTTDNKTCQVFRNLCTLQSTNCYRRNNNCQPEARDIGKDRCQELCKTPCVNSNTTPICGYYNDERRNFDNQCEMDNVNCATGKTFSLYSEGLCPQ